MSIGNSTFRPVAGREDKLRESLQHVLDPQGLDGILSMHLIESDPALSGPTTEIPSTASAGAGDWFMLMDATDVNAFRTVGLAARLKDTTGLIAAVISIGTYRLMWDLAKSDIALT